ncbi:hypothetical protein ACE6H2_011919 [Prunus campanulata]
MYKGTQNQIKNQFLLSSSGMNGWPLLEFDQILVSAFNCMRYFWSSPVRSQTTLILWVSTKCLGKCKGLLYLPI